MQKGIGVACLIAGIMLIIWGYNLHQSVSGRITEAVTGAPGDKSMYLYIGGAVLTVLGLFQVFRPSK